MRDENKADLLVNFDCQVCGKKSAYPVLQANPGVKCKYCGAELAYTDSQCAQKASFLLLAGHKKDVNWG